LSVDYVLLVTLNVTLFEAILILPTSLSVWIGR